jgi:hypothetical protein
MFTQKDTHSVLSNNHGLDPTVSVSLECGNGAIFPWGLKTAATAVPETSSALPGWPGRC